jgi:hypothetical protein
LTELDDAMQKQMSYLVFVENRPFSYADFLKFEVNEKEYSMTHGTFRNKITQFVRSEKVEVAYRSGPTFYTLKGVRFGKHKLMTPNRTGVPTSNNPFYKFIKDLPMNKHALHDIRLRFKVNGIWSMLSSKLELHPVSKDITLQTWTFNNLILKTIVHKTDTISVIVGCSYRPIAVDINGIIRLTEALTRVEERLSVLVNQCRSISNRSSVFLSSLSPVVVLIPQHTSWIVTMWHFGMDGITEYTGEKFSVTWEIGKNELIRVYSKDLKEKGTRIRLERQEYPHKPLSDAIEEKLCRCTLHNEGGV